MGLSINKG